MAVDETFTGGLLVYTLSGVKDYRRFLKGGLVVSSELAETAINAADLAVQTREKYSADIGIAINGQTGDDLEAGLANIAINSKDGRFNLAAALSGRPATLRRRAVIQALFSLRQVLVSR